VVLCRYLATLFLLFLCSFLLLLLVTVLPDHFINILVDEKILAAIRPTHL